MRRIVPCKSLTYASGGHGLVELDQLPLGHYLKGFLFNLPLTVTGAASSQAAILPNAFNRCLDQLKIGRRVSTTGQALNVLHWLMTGRDNSATAYIPANTASAFDRVVNIAFPLFDPTGYEPDDCSAAVEVFKDTPLDVTFGNNGIIFPGCASVVAGNFTTLAIIEKGAPGKVATPVQLDVIDLVPDSRLDPGIYTHLGLMKEDGTGISSTEVTGLTVIIDGVPVIDNATLPQLAALFNVLKAQGDDPASYAITTPFATLPGEGISDQPGAAAGAGAVVTADFIPVLYSQNSGKLTKAWAAPTGIRIKWTGSATGLRCVTRRIEQVSDAQALKAGAKMGVPATRLAAKTSSKVAPAAGSWVESIVPKKLS
jgi:hypothetical protein